MFYPSTLSLGTGYRNSLVGMLAFDWKLSACNSGSKRPGLGLAPLDSEEMSVFIRPSACSGYFD